MIQAGTDIVLSYPQGGIIILLRSVNKCPHNQLPGVKRKIQRFINSFCPGRITTIYSDFGPVHMDL